MSHDVHDHHDHDVDSLGVAVLTISSSRSLDEDNSGDAIVSLFEEAGHTVVTRDLVTDDIGKIRSCAQDLLVDTDVDALITTGGTGVSPDDVTIPALEPLFDLELDGFGERFRAKSVDDVGIPGILSRATAGVIQGRPVICLPGSRAAVQLGVSELVLPILEHLVSLADEGNEDAAKLTHVDSKGNAEMVDIGTKQETLRRAVAAGRLELQTETIEAIRADEIEKGNVLAAVRIGAIDAVKHTWEMIPMCHQIPITNVEIEANIGSQSLELEVSVETTAKTGPEMEALHGVTTALNVAWDMIKAAEKNEAGQYPETRISDVHVVEKRIQR